MRTLAILLCVLAMNLVPLDRATAAPGSPADVVQQFYAALLEAMKDGPKLGTKGRYQQLEPVVRASFDVPFMTKMAIGLTWGRLSPDEKRRAASAFGRYVTATYAANFADYSGERFEVLGEEKVKHGTIVRTRIVPPSGDHVAINYMLHDNDTAWQIRDVYLTGTISELATRRSEFSATLQKGGIEALIARLNQKANDLQG